MRGSKQIRHYDNHIYLYGKDIASYRLNWCNRKELEANLGFLSPAQKHLFRLIEVKRTEFAGGFKKGNYFHNAYPIIASEAPFATRLVCCGRKTSWNGTGSCQKWRFCSRCAYARQMAAVAMFSPAFPANHFAFATIAFRGSARVTDSQKFASLLDYWNAIDRAVKFLKSEGLILGAYFVEELSLATFLPLSVLPHSHAVFHIDPFAGYDSEDIKTALVAMLSDFDGENGPLALVPSVKVREVGTASDFYHYLRYCTKAVDLRTRYQSALRTIAQADIQQRANLNGELRRFLHGWAAATHERYAIRKIGSMHHAAKNFVGVKTYK